MKVFPEYFTVFNNSCSRQSWTFLALNPFIVSFFEFLNICRIITPLTFISSFSLPLTSIIFTTPTDGKTWISTNYVAIYIFFDPSIESAPHHDEENTTHVHTHIHLRLPIFLWAVNVLCNQPLPHKWSHRRLTIRNHKAPYQRRDEASVTFLFSVSQPVDAGRVRVCVGEACILLSTHTVNYTYGVKPATKHSSIIRTVVYNRVLL